MDCRIALSGVVYKKKTCTNSEEQEQEQEQEFLWLMTEESMESQDHLKSDNVWGSGLGETLPSTLSSDSGCDMILNLTQNSIKEKCCAVLI